MIIAFDTETYPDFDEYGNEFQRFLTLAWCIDGQTFFSDSEEDLSLIFNRNNYGAWIFAHNLSFDYGVIRKWLERRYHCEMRFSKGKLICIKVKTKNFQQNGKYHSRRNLFTLADSLNFFQMSLDKLAKKMGLEKIPLHEQIGWDKEKMYQSMDIVYKQWPDLVREYNEEDARIVWRSMQNIEDFTGKISSTVGSTTMRFFKSKYGFPTKIDPRFNEEQVIFMKLGQRGGITTAFWRGMIHSDNWGPIRYLDINSEYPHCMRKPMPDISKFPSDKRTGTMDLDSLGFTDCVVKLDSKFPVLPIIYDKKMTNPQGTFRGVFTISELLLMETLGIGEVKQIFRSIEYEPVESFFTEFIEEMYDLRWKFKDQNDPTEQVVKLLMNSLYGKFGETIFPESIETGIVEGGVYNEYLDVTSITSEEMKLTANTFPAVASQITAEGRMMMYEIYREIEARGKEVFYSDTDSVITNADLPIDEKALGALSPEPNSPFDWVLPLRAKWYLTPYDVKLKGARSASAEGILDAMRNDEPYYSTDDMTFSKMKGSLRRNIPLNTRLMTHKNFSMVGDGKREYLKEIPIRRLPYEATGSRPLTLTYP